MNIPKFRDIQAKMPSPKVIFKGFKYPLDHYQLKDREGLGVSNEITADVADVSWEQGVLLMIQSKD